MQVFYHLFPVLIKETLVSICYVLYKLKNIDVVMKRENKINVIYCLIVYWNLKRPSTSIHIIQWRCNCILSFKILCRKTVNKLERYLSTFLPLARCPPKIWEKKSIQLKFISAICPLIFIFNIFEVWHVISYFNFTQPKT